MKLNQSNIIQNPIHKNPISHIFYTQRRRHINQSLPSTKPPTNSTQIHINITQNRNTNIKAIPNKTINRFHNKQKTPKYKILSTSAKLKNFSYLVIVSYLPKKENHYQKIIR